MAILLIGGIGWTTTWLWGLGIFFTIVAAIWVLIDFAIIVVGGMKDADGRPITRW